MSLRGDDRGQAIQVGAVLLFAALIIAFSTYQAFVVPNQNQDVEFSHNQLVQEQLQDLRNGVVSVPDGGTGQSISIQLGTRYPSRLVALNPGPASGSLRTFGTTEATVNVSVINASADGETEDFWDGTTRNYSSGALVYTPNYNEYQQAPSTIYDNTVLVNQYQERNLTLAGQQLIDGRDITLISLNGSLSISRTSAVTVDLQAVSTSTRTVPITNPSAGENVTIGFATKLNESTWRTLLEDEFDDPDVASDDRYIYNLTTRPIPGTEFNRLEIRLEQNTQYNLHLSRVGVGTGVESPSAAYLTTVSGDGSTIEEDSTQQLVVEVRDRFNNPVSGHQVQAAVAGSSAGRITDVSKTTNEVGRVTFEYNAPREVSGVTQQRNTINIGIRGNPATPSFDPETAQNVSMSVVVENTNGDGLSSGGASLDAGQGGTSTYTPQDDSVLVSSANGRWQSINRTDQMLLYGGTPIIEPGTSRELVHTEFSVRNGNEAFSVDVEAAQATGGAYSGSVSVYSFGSDIQVSRSLTANAARRLLTVGARYDGVDILNRANYQSTGTGTFTSYQQTIAGMDQSPTEVIFATQEGRVDIALQGETLFTAIEPDPDTGNDDDEFVRLYFENETNTNGWTIEDDDGSYSLPDQRLQGEYYFTKSRSTFTGNHPSIDTSRVFETDLRLANSGEALEVRDESGILRDEVAYGSQSTSNGWSLTLGTNDVGVRSTYGDDVYEDTNSSSDWTVESESSFFGSAGGSPTADFTYTSQGNPRNDKWDLDASPSSDPDNDITTYDWDIDDDGNYEETGQTLNGVDISSGTDVTLLVTDSQGNTDTRTRTIN